MNRSSLCFLAVLLLLPTVPAQAESAVSVEKASIRGDAEIHSSTVFWDLIGNYAGHRNLTIESKGIRVELDRDYDENYLYSDSNENPNTTVLHDGPGRVLTGAVRDGHRLGLLAQDAEVTLFADRLDLAPKPKNTVNRTGGEGPDRGVNGTETFVLGPQFMVKNVEGTLVVEGDFSFNLIEWDGIIEHPDGRDQFWTGQRVEDRGIPGNPLSGETEDVRGVPDHREAGAYVEWQVVYVFVTDGRIEIPIRFDDSNLRNFMADAKGIVSGGVSLTPVSDSEAASVSVNGRFGIDVLAPAKDTLYVDLYQPLPSVGSADSGTPPVATEDSPGVRPDAVGSEPSSGSSLSPTTQTPQLPTSNSNYWLLLLLIPALAAGITYLYHIRPTRRMHKLEDAYDLALYPFLVDNAPKLVKHPRFGVQASIMYTVALIEERGADEAEAHLDGVRASSRPTGATLDFLMARIRAAQTRFDEAREHVRSCLAEEPAFIMEVRRHRMLEFLTRPPSDPGEGYA